MSAAISPEERAELAPLVAAALRALRPLAGRLSKSTRDIVSPIFLAAAADPDVSAEDLLDDLCRFMRYDRVSAPAAPDAPVLRLVRDAPSAGLRRGAGAVCDALRPRI